MHARLRRTLAAPMPLAAVQLEMHRAAGDCDARAAILSYYPGRSGDLAVLPNLCGVTLARADGGVLTGALSPHGPSA